VETKLIDLLLSTIGDIIDAEGNWTDKKEAIIQQCDNTDKTNLFEFITWFEDMEWDENDGDEETETKEPNGE
jgi:hypothetical protein